MFLNRESVKVLNVFNTLTLIQIFMFKDWIEILKLHHFHSKRLCHKPMLRQVEWWLQNGPIIKSGLVPVTTLFFWEICSLEPLEKG